VTTGIPIAVIGLGGRFPGSDGPDANGPSTDGVDALWTVLRNEVDAIRDVPAGRWPSSEAADERGGFIEQGDWFDAPLFGITDREAERMDPQQGLVLEAGWQALEHAGLAPDSLAGAGVGVFVGASTCDFDRRLALLDDLDARAATGGSGSIVANRLSYTLGVCGPSLSIDVACASSLAAVHLACQALQLGECDLALAGGVQLILSPVNMRAFTRGGMLARDGRTKSFSAQADGYGCGEGCGMIALKRLDEAVRDRDTIWAIVRGSAVNHNGASNGLSAPFGRAQELLLRRALALGDVAPASIGYVEAHSAGTLLGDAIEVKALKHVLSEGRDADRPCLLGSVKPNLGHLEGAAGIASLMKAILAMHHGWIPKTLHCDPISGHLQLANSALRVASVSQPWPAHNHPRRAGVSAFSFGGANAHIVLEQAPPTPARAPVPARDRWVLPIGAASRGALRVLASRYVEHLATVAAAADPQTACADLCYTASVGRAHLPHRLAVIAETPERARQRLLAFLGERSGGWLYGYVSTPQGAAEAAGGDANALARAYVTGAGPDWRAVYADGSYRRQPQPTYAFERRRYWMMPDAALALRQA